VLDKEPVSLLQGLAQLPSEAAFSKSAEKAAKKAPFDIFSRGAPLAARYNSFIIGIPRALQPAGNLPFRIFQ
jgi:hypothetical protein